MQYIDSTTNLTISGSKIITKNFILLLQLLGLHKFMSIAPHWDDCKSTVTVSGFVIAAFAKVKPLKFSTVTIYSFLIQLIMFLCLDFHSLSKILYYFSIQLLISCLFWYYFEGRFGRFSSLKLRVSKHEI